MTSIPSASRIIGIVTILLALGAFGLATSSRAQTAAPVASPAQSTFCGSQPLCYEASDFAATVTDFRTSTSGGLRLIDVDVRFQNKTNQPLILGYVMNSGTALDDRGNRYGVWGPNGFRGIGVVYGGTNFDPKFNIRPGSFSDAQFELAWAPGQTAYGLTFELNMTVDEINTIEAGQHTLGGEFPLHYRSLTNGVSSAAPGQATAFMPPGQGITQGLPPCGPAATALGAANSAGGQLPASGQAPAGTNAAVSNATAAISSFGSLFGKKKTAAPAAPTTSSSAPCAAAATSGGTASTTSAPGTTPASTASGTTAQPTRATATATAPPAPVAKTATSATAKPVATVAKAPAPAPQPTATAKKPAPIPPAQKTAQKTVPTNQ
jgi:hypothetical protein